MTAYLFDTHLLIWAAGALPRLPRRAAALMNDNANDRRFSAVSVGEVAIKFAARKPDFTLNPIPLRRGLLDSGFTELPLTGEQATHLLNLPTVHKDPFDRLLVAQAMAEGITLVTANATLGRYGPRVLVV